MKKIWLAMLLVGSMGLAAIAAQTPVTPFLRPETTAVIRIDMSAIDMDALSAWRKQLLADATPAQKAELAKQDEQSKKDLENSKKWLRDFVSAGGREMYGVLEANGFMMNDGGEMIVPITGANADALAKVLNPPPPPPPATDPQNPQTPPAPPMESPNAMKTEVIGNVMVYCTPPTLQRLKNPPIPGQAPMPPPHNLMDDALTAGGPAAIQIAATPDSLQSPIIMFFMASIPGMMHPGPDGQPVGPMGDPQWKDATWILLSATMPPKQTLNLCVQCKSPAGAADLAKLMNDKITARMAKMPPQQQAKLQSLKAFAAGDQVKIHLDSTALDSVAKSLMLMSAQPRNRGMQPGMQPPPEPDNNQPQAPGAPGDNPMQNNPGPNGPDQNNPSGPPNGM